MEIELSKENIETDVIKKKSFATGINFYKLFWIFYIGCIFGVFVETIWCFVTNGHFESRTALILAQLNPIYGLGAVLITLFFATKSNNLFIFCGCGVLGGIFEYLCSLFQELIFGTVSWYYSADSLGIFDRTSLIYCMFWGFLGIFWVKVIYPFLSKTIEKIPNKLGIHLTYILFLLISFDIVFSCKAVYRQTQRRENVEATTVIDHFYDTHYTDNILKKIYPNMSIAK
ncbi:MAG: putative ABC transporter permease [Clostridia bacterium]